MSIDFEARLRELQQQSDALGTPPDDPAARIAHWEQAALIEDGIERLYGLYLDRHRGHLDDWMVRSALVTAAVHHRQVARDCRRAATDARGLLARHSRGGA